MKHLVRMMGRSEQKAGAQTGMPEKKWETSITFFSNSKEDITKTIHTTRMLQASIKYKCDTENGYCRKHSTTYVLTRWIISCVFQRRHKYSSRLLCDLSAHIIVILNINPPGKEEFCILHMR